MKEDESALTQEEHKPVELQEAKHTELALTMEAMFTETGEQATRRVCVILVAAELVNPIRTSAELNAEAHAEQLNPHDAKHCAADAMTEDTAHTLFAVTAFPKAWANELAIALVTPT